MDLIEPLETAEKSIARAAALDAAGDPRGAVDLLRTVLLAFPASEAARRDGIRILRRQGWLQEAEDWATSALRRDQASPVFLEEAARVAESRRDWDAVLARWQSLQKLRPAMSAACQGAATALRELGRLDEAETMLRQATGRFPDDGGLIADRARMAERRSDWVAAEGFWRVAAALEDARPWHHSGLANALRVQGKHAQAEEVLLAAQARAPDDLGLCLEYARLADARKDWEEAIRRWGILRDRFPDRSVGFVAQAGALRQLRRHQEAMDLLAAAALRFPEDAAIFHELGKAAMDAGDWGTAEQHWREALSRVPLPWWVHAELASCLRQQGKLEQAAQALADGQVRHPAEIALYVESARLAERAQDWPEAARRWRLVRERFPDGLQGYVGEAQALLQQQNNDAAAAVLRDAAARFPNNAPLQHELGKFAAARADWAAAEAHYRAALSFGGQPWFVYTDLAAALRQQDRLAEAETVLADGQADHPAEIQVFAEHARLPEFSRDWQEAERRWLGLRRRFPDHWLANVGHASVLRTMRRLEDARESLRQAASRFPREAVVHYELGKLASVEADWAAAERHLREALSLGRQPWWMHAELGAAVRQQGRLADAETILLDGIGRHPDQYALFIDHARLAAARNDRDEAERRWQGLLARFADHPEVHMAAAAALRDSGRPDEAAALLIKAAARFPDRPAFAFDLARLAGGRGDWAAAEAYWRRGIASDPGAAHAHVGLALALARQARADEASALLLARQAEDAGEIGYFSTHAQIAEEQRDWGTAYHRWQEVQTRFPDRAAGYEGSLRALRELGRMEEGQALSAAGIAQFPDQPGILLEAARLAQAAGNDDDALRLWALLRTVAPDKALAYLGAEEILRKQRRFDEAEAMLAEAFRRFPDEWVIWRERGDLAEAREDWPEAVVRWNAMGKRFEGPNGQSWRLFQALLRLAEIDPDAADRVSDELGLRKDYRDVGVDDPAALQALALSFESLGGSGPAGGCEFGGVQRECGTEPLGLFRWATVYPDALIACLNARFDGIGDPNTTKIYLAEGESDLNWRIRETRYGIGMHSFVSSTEVSYDRMVVLTQKRMQYLKAKLIGDLEEPTKIFVLKVAEGAFTQQDMDEISKAIRAYGPGEILCIRPSDGDHPAQTVELRAPGLFVGYVDFSDEPNYMSRRQPMLDLCRRTLALSRPMAR